MGKHLLALTMVALFVGPRGAFAQAVPYSATYPPGGFIAFDDATIHPIGPADDGNLTVFRLPCRGVSISATTSGGMVVPLVQCDNSDEARFGYFKTTFVVDASNVILNYKDVNCVGIASCKSPNLLWANWQHASGGIGMDENGAKFPPRWVWIRDELGVVALAAPTGTTKYVCVDDQGKFFASSSGC